MREEMLNVVPVIRSAKNTPEVERIADERIATGAEKLRNSNRSTIKIRTMARTRTV